MFALFKFFLLSFALCSFAMNSHVYAQEIAEDQLTSPDVLLQEVINRSATINTLKTTFMQKKHVDFLKNPIETSGLLYFAKHGNNSYSLLWEYSAPSLSGLWFHNETAWVWTQSRNNIREPQKHEKQFISIMIHQLIFWLQIDLQEVIARYNLELVADRTIKLIPRRKDIFKSIVVTFNEDLQGLEKLVLDEGSGNFISLAFVETEYNTPKLNIFPNGTPFP